MRHKYTFSYSIRRFRARNQIGPNDPDYELASDNSLRLRRVRLRDLGPYVCQAYNTADPGARAASFEVTALAQGPLASASAAQEDRQYLQYVIDHSSPSRGGGGRGGSDYYRTRPPGGIYRCVHITNIFPLITN